MAIPAAVLNDLFAHKIGSSEGKEKVAAAGGTYIRDRLREVSFARQVLPPEMVTRADCQRSVNHDTLVKIIDIEPESRAMAITFRGQPSARFIRAPRAEIPFYTIASEKFEKVEQELLAYDMPITKVIEDNSVKDIQEIEDREFLIHIEASVQALQQEAAPGVALAASTIGTTAEFSVRKGELARVAASDNATVLPLQRPDLVELYKMLDGERLRAERTLMTETEFDDILQWTTEDFGDRIQSETTVDGYKYNTLLGRNFIRTIKTDILRRGNVYTFTSPDFFGKFFILNNTKFYIDKRFNLIEWQSWEDIAIGIINIAGVRKLELYSGNASPNGGSQTLIPNFTPKGEDDLGAVNNRADQGLTFPQVNQF